MDGNTNSEQKVATKRTPRAKRIRAGRKKCGCGRNVRKSLNQ